MLKSSGGIATGSTQATLNASAIRCLSPRLTYRPHVAPLPELSNVRSACSCSGMLPPMPYTPLEDRLFLYEISDETTRWCAARFWTLGHENEVPGFDQVSLWGGGYAGPSIPEWFVRNLAKSTAGVLFYARTSQYTENLLATIFSIVKRHGLLLFIVRCDDSAVPSVFDRYPLIDANVEGVASLVAHAVSTSPPMREARQAPPVMSASGPVLQVKFDPKLSHDEMLGLLNALGDLYRACGGYGLSAEKAMDESEMFKGVDD